MKAAPHFERAAHRRKDRDYLHGLLAAPNTLVLPVWRNQSFIATGASDASLPELRGVTSLIDAADEIVWLGMRGDAACFAVDLSTHEQPLSLITAGVAGQFSDLRLALAALGEADARLLAYARGMLHWHRTQRFCGKCGHQTDPKQGGHVRECEHCGQKHFPRTDAAVMVLIEHEDRCLLARQPAFPKGMYSALAGFVEPGESLEETVAREAFEEVGLEVKVVGYAGSQPWPFPASLMIGFHARAHSAELHVDHEELEAARWVSREELASPRDFFYPGPFSLANLLINEFLAR